MRSCKECKNDFSDSDTHNPDFCSKWCEKKFEDERTGAVVGVGINIIGKTLKQERFIDDFRGNPLAKVVKDKSMFRAITEGNASDKSLTRDVSQVLGPTQDKAKLRREKMDKIKMLKARYRSRYGQDA